MTHLNAFDKYPVEDFHSILRAQTSYSDNADILHQKAQAFDSNKATSKNFCTVFSVPEKYAFSRSGLEELKLHAARFICEILRNIKDAPDTAYQLPRLRRE